MSYTLDEIDLKILDVMQQDASLTSSELADRVSLSQSPCWRRVQRLREDGFIQRIVAIVDKRRMGMNLQVLAQAKMTTLTDKERAAFMETIHSIPQILECMFVLGESDILLRIVAPDVEWYQAFVKDVLLRMPGIIEVRSMVIASELKSTTALPIAPARPAQRSSTARR